MPLHFEPTRVRPIPGPVSRAGSGYTMFLTDTESVMVLRGPAPRQRFHGRRMPFEEQQPAPEPTVLRMRLSGAAHPKRVSGGKPSAGVVNYFLVTILENGVRNVPTYGSVRYEGVYPGVDLVYYGSQRQLECDFVVAPAPTQAKSAWRFRSPGYSPRRPRRPDFRCWNRPGAHAAAGDLPIHRWR